MYKAVIVIQAKSVELLHEITSQSALDAAESLGNSAESEWKVSSYAVASGFDVGAVISELEMYSSEQDDSEE